MTTEIITPETMKFFIDHMEGVASSLSVIVSLFVLFQMIKEKREDSHDKQIEIYMDLSKQWDFIWAKITSFPQKNKELFRMDISEIEDENQRLSLANAINLLARVFFYYEKTKQDIRSSDWHKTVKYVFSKKLFYSIYNKHEYRYSEAFRKYVKDVRAEHKAKNVVELTIKKEEKSHRSV